MTPKQKALAIVQRVAVANGVYATDLLGWGRTPLIDRVRGEAYCTLHTELGWTHAAIGRLFGRNRSTVYQVIERQKSKPKVDPDVHEEIDTLRRQLRVLSGVDLAGRLAVGLGLKRWQAQFLAICIEAHPRCLTRSQMCQLYDVATEISGGGRASDGVSDSMCKAAISRVNAAFDLMSLPRPFHSRPNVGVNLVPEMAVWFANNYGRPFMPGAYPASSRRLGATPKGENEECRYYVYAIAVDGDVAYIGKGSGRRAWHHVQGASTNRDLARRIAKAEAGNRPVQVRILEKGLSEADAFERERRWLDKFHHRLTNRAGGRRFDGQVSPNLKRIGQAKRKAPNAAFNSIANAA